MSHPRPSRRANTSREYWRIAPVVASLALLATMIAGAVPGKEIPRLNLPRLPGAAAKHAELAQQKRKDEIKLRFKQGVAMLQIGEYEHAVTAFHRVLALNPELPEAHVNIGFAFYELRDYAAAQRFFEGALALAPSLNNARYGLAISLLQQGDAGAAKTLLLAFLERTGPDDPFRAKAVGRLREAERALLSKRAPHAAMPSVASEGRPR